MAEDHLEKNRLWEALESCDRAIDLDSGEPSLFALRAAVYAELSEFSKALKDHDHAVALDESDGYLLIARAECLLKAGSPGQALLDYEDALEIDGLSVSEDLLVQILSALGDDKLASAELTKAIERNPRRADLYIARGRVRLKLDRWRGAASDFRTATRLMREDPKKNRILRQEILRFHGIDEPPSSRPHSSGAIR